jgi:hypothetical protein
MQLSICGSYADATDRAVFSAAVNKMPKKFICLVCYTSRSFYFLLFPLECLITALLDIVVMNPGRLRNCKDLLPAISHIV